MEITEQVLQNEGWQARSNPSGTVTFAKHIHDTVYEVDLLDGAVKACWRQTASGLYPVSREEIESLLQ